MREFHDGHVNVRQQFLKFTAIASIARIGEAHSAAREPISEREQAEVRHRRGRDDEVGDANLATGLDLDVLDGPARPQTRLSHARPSQREQDLALSTESRRTDHVQRLVTLAADGVLEEEERKTEDVIGVQVADQDDIEGRQIDPVTMHFEHGRRRQIEKNASVNERRVPLPAVGQRRRGT
jgi:hypothetical protein